MQRNFEAKQNAYDGNSGSGAVKIQDMDDVDTDTALLNGEFYNSIPLLVSLMVFTRVTEAIIQEGTANDKIVLDGTDSDGTEVRTLSKLRGR